MSKHDLIMIPGWGMSGAIWSPLEKELAVDFNLSPVDWTGVEAPDGFVQNALRCVPDDAGRTFSIMGWSLGSLVALTLAARYPRRVARLILFGGTSRFIIDKSGGYFGGWPLKVIQKIKADLIKAKEKTLFDFYQSMFSQSERHSEQSRRFLQEFGFDLLRQPVETLLAGLDYLIFADCRPHLLRIKAPLLLIHGSQDRICPVKAVEYIRSQVRVETRYRMVPDGGHMLFFTRPDQCLREIDRFMKHTAGGVHD